MGHEVDQHQHELTALQDVQRQKLAEVTRRHRQELAEYEERIEELEEQLQNGERAIFEDWVTVPKQKKTYVHG